MDPLAVIKKNAGWYVVKIIVTGIAAFAGIILTKRQLTPQDFLDFNLLANGVALLNSFLIGWFVQSIIRFYHAYHYFFRVRNIVLILSVNFVFIGLPVFFVWEKFIGINESVVYPLIFMMLNALFTTFLSLYQASNQARIVAAAESLRSAIIIVPLFVPVIADVRVGTGYFWIIWIASCFVPSVYLFQKRRLLNDSIVLHSGESGFQVSEKTSMIVRRVIKFGLPLSAWMFVSFLLLNADRWYVYKSGIPDEIAANYVAISDLMMRGTGFLFSPIVSSAYPLISSLFDQGMLAEVRKIMRKVIWWEVLLASGAAVGFLVTHQLVFRLLQIGPHDYLMLIAGLIMIVINTIWQISAMLHKVAELGLQTTKLFVALSLATGIVYAGYYLVVKPSSLLTMIGVLSIGFVLYFLYTYALYATYKWNLKDGRL